MLDLASTRLRSLLRQDTVAPRPAAVAAVGVLALVLCGCVAGDPQFTPEDPAGFGHAHLIERTPHGVWAGADDPRAMTGAAVAAP